MNARPWRESRRWGTTMTAHNGAVACLAHIDNARDGFLWWVEDVLAGRDVADGAAPTLVKAKRACADAFAAHVEKMTRAKGGAL